MKGPLDKLIKSKRERLKRHKKKKKHSLPPCRLTVTEALREPGVGCGTDYLASHTSNHSMTGVVRWRGGKVKEDYGKNQ